MNKILFIPNISMRDRKTNLYNLQLDGNLSRTLSYCERNKDKKFTVLLPSLNLCTAEAEDFVTEYISSVENSNIEFESSEYWPTDVHKLRGGKCKRLMWQIFRMANKYNEVMFESQAIGKMLLRKWFKKYETTYMCPVSAYMDNGIEAIPKFLQEFHKDDEKLIKKSNTTIFAAREQAEFFNRYIGFSYKIFKDFVPPSFLKAYDNIEPDTKFDHNVFFFPFRLTDEGYNFFEFVQALDMAGAPCEVYYTDPNNTFDTWSGLPKHVKFIKVSSDKKTYVSFLKNKKVIVPYYENPGIVHASLCELEYFKTKVLGDKKQYPQLNIVKDVPNGNRIRLAEFVPWLTEHTFNR